MSNIARYQETGFAAPIRVLAEDEAADLNEMVQSLRRRDPATADLALGTNCHLLFPRLYDLTLNDRVLDAVEQVLGPDILVWSAGFFLKDPNSEKFVSWHQDSTYWGLEPPDIVTAWIALTPSTPESGCMRVVPGSHLKGQLAHADTFSDTNMLSRGQEVQVDVDEADAHDIVLRPGEMSLHHVRIVHGSEPNRAAHPRVGFAIRYIPTYVRQAGGRTFAVPARGTDRFKHFDIPRRPDADLDEAAWEMHTEALDRLSAVVMQGAAQESKVVDYARRESG